MKALKRKWVTVLLIGALGAISLFPDAGMGAGATKFMKDLRGETVLLPPSAPERERLTLVSFVNVISEAEIVGAIALYDDPRTEAATDYMEMYDGAGGLIPTVSVGPPWTLDFFRKKLRGSKGFLCSF